MQGMTREQADKATIKRYIGSDMEEGDSLRFALVGAVQGNPDAGIYIFRRHWDGKHYQDCQRGPNDPESACPYCSDPSVSTQVRAHIAVYGLDTHTQHVLKMSYAWLKTQERGRFTRKPPSEWSFLLVATGPAKTKDRRYEVDTDDRLSKEDIATIKALTVFSGDVLADRRDDEGVRVQPGDPGPDASDPLTDPDDVPF